MINSFLASLEGLLTRQEIVPETEMELWHNGWKLMIQRCGIIEVLLKVRIGCQCVYETIGCKK